MIVKSLFKFLFQPSILFYARVLLDLLEFRTVPVPVCTSVIQYNSITIENDKIYSDCTSVFR